MWRVWDVKSIVKKWQNKLTFSWLEWQSRGWQWWWCHPGGRESRLKGFETRCDQWNILTCAKIQGVLRICCHEILEIGRQGYNLVADYLIFCNTHDTGHLKLFSKSGKICKFEIFILGHSKMEQSVGWNLCGSVVMQDIHHHSEIMNLNWFPPS